MDINIGEMSIGDILGRGMKLLFKRLPYFYAIQLMVALPGLISELASPYLPPGAGLLPLLAALVLGPLGSAAMLRVIVQEYLDGEVSMGEAFQFAGGRFLALLGTSILFGLLVGLGFVLCVIPGIYLATIWSMMSQVVVVEDTAGMEALNRSKRLTEGYFGHVFAVLFLLGLLQLVTVFGANFGLAVLLPFQQFAVPGDNPFAGVQISHYTNYAIVTVATTLLTIFVQAYGAVCLTLMYFDLRNRKEGYDLPLEFAKIAAWRDRRWDDDDDDGMAPPPGTPATGIKEAGTVLPPARPPETGIQEPPAL